MLLQRLLYSVSFFCPMITTFNTYLVLPNKILCIFMGGEAGGPITNSAYTITIRNTKSRTIGIFNWMIPTPKLHQSELFTMTLIWT